MLRTGMIRRTTGSLSSNYSGNLHKMLDVVGG